MSLGSILNYDPLRSELESCLVWTDGGATHRRWGRVATPSYATKDSLTHRRAARTDAAHPRAARTVAAHPRAAMKVAAHPRAARTVAVHPRAARTVATSSRAALVPQPHRATHPREARDAPASPSHSTEGGSGMDASASPSHSTEGGNRCFSLTEPLIRGRTRTPPREMMDASASPCPSRTQREATEVSASLCPSRTLHQGRMPPPHRARVAHRGRQQRPQPHRFHTAPAEGNRCLTLPQPGGKASLILKSSPSSRTSPWDGR